MVTASDEIATRLAVPDKALESARTGLALLKEHVVGSDAERPDSVNIVFEVCRDSEQHTLRLNDALVGQNQAGKLTRSQVT